MAEQWGLTKWEAMINCILPKPGERWRGRSGKLDPLLQQIDHYRFRAAEFRQQDALHPRKHVSPASIRQNHRDFNAFPDKCENRNKTHPISSGVGQHGNGPVGSGSIRKYRVCLSVDQGRDSGFPVCTMELHKIDFGDPIEFLPGFSSGQVGDKSIWTCHHLSRPTAMAGIRLNPAN